jgi:hypothetical protein
LKGVTGATGPAGAKGATGATGPAGKNLEFTWNGYTLGVRQQGQTTYTYSQSLRGATGATGPQGLKGDKGDSGVWTGGTVTNNITVQKSGAYLELYHSSSSYWRIQNGLSGNYDLTFNFKGTTMFYMSYNGNAWCKGSLVQASDIRLKNRMDDVTNILDKIKNVSPFYFTRKDDEYKIPHIGISAQEIREIFPELVTLVNPGGKAYGEFAVDYATLGVVVSIAGLKELLERLELLEQKISA